MFKTQCSCTYYMIAVYPRLKLNNITSLSRYLIYKGNKEFLWKRLNNVLIVIRDGNVKSL
jgi:predicted RNase H-like nuclease